MMKMKFTLVLVLIIAAQLISSTACWASVPTGSTIKGVVWLDENRNGIFEPSEETIPNAVVNIRRQNEDLIQSAIVGEDGYFEISNLPRGLYNVWAEANGSESETVVIEINEVSPVTVIDIAFTPEAVDLPHQIWLPLVAH